MCSHFANTMPIQYIDMIWPFNVRSKLTEHWPYFKFQMWERWGCVGGLGACVKYHCSSLSFFLLFLFLHLAYRSPQWTDFHDLYVKICTFVQGSSFWVSMINFHIFSWKFWNFVMRVTLAAKCRRRQNMTRPSDSTARLWTWSSSCWQNLLMSGIQDLISTGFRRTSTYTRYHKNNISTTRCHRNN